MKKALLIIGIIVIAAGVLVILLGQLFKFVSMNTLDGSFSLYTKQRRMMIVHLIAGIVIVICGIVCLIIRRKVG